MRATLRISAAEVSLVAGANKVGRRPRGLYRSTADVARALEWRWVHPDPAGPGEVDAALLEVGRRLTEEFLAGPVGAALAAEVAEAERLNKVLELGVEIADPALANLPWEALYLPEASGEVAQVGGHPLALHSAVALYRLISGPGMTPARKIKGPLRLLVAIASPETKNAELLDYEAELARIVAAMEPTRGKAYVRVLNEGSLAAINAALSEDPEGFHILHLSCHARPGELLLETMDGQPDPVGAQRLLEEGVPTGAELPMVVLAGCSTGLAARQARLHSGTAAAASNRSFMQRVNEGEAALESFAVQLVDAGVPQVLAMQAPVTDRYATALSGEFYQRLATDALPDPLLALAGARRAAERHRQALPPGSPLRRRAEWATPALTSQALRLPLFNRDEPFAPVHRPHAFVLTDGLVGRDIGEFVGRRREMREARRVLGGPKAGLVLYGIGGVGKSTLAAEVLRSLGGNAGPLVSRAGQVSVDDVLGEVGARLHQVASTTDGGESLAQAGLLLRASDVEWADRWRLLAEQILPILPMKLLLDNFEDNLREADAGAWRVRDSELAAFLAGWVQRPGLSRLVFTCQHPFTLPGAAEQRLADIHLGPLSAAETKKLIWRLPGLDNLPPEDKDRAYRDVGGHPRTLQYLDALLRGGQARFDDIAKRMEDRLRGRGIADPAAWLARPGRDLDANLAEAVTLSVDDVVLSDLLKRLAATPVASELVIGASVYRIPVDDTALIFQVGQPVERLPDPERLARMRRVLKAFMEATGRSDDGHTSLEDMGLSPEDYARYEADYAEEFRPPVDAPTGLATAVAAARAAGLLVPVPLREQPTLHFVHRWTAGAIAALRPAGTKDAHRRAAAFWHWRVDNIHQNRAQEIDQLLEARYHHYAAGDMDEAMAVHRKAVIQLQDWGQYGRAVELCRETLTWLPPGSLDAGANEATLGVLAQLRGDYDTAERAQRQALKIFEDLGDQAGVAAAYHQLGLLAQQRGDYGAAESLYRRSLAITERLDNQNEIADTHHQLGMMAQLQGDYDTAESSYRRALEINERLGDQAGIARGHHQLGMMAQLQGDYDTAESSYRRALAIDERLGNQASIASVYGELGVLAQLRGDYDTAESLHRRALEINERLGNQVGASVGYHELGRLAELRGDYSSAEPLYRRSLEISERLGDQAGIAACYFQLGVLAHNRGDYDSAEPLYRRSLEIFEFLDEPSGIASGFGQLGMLAHDREDYETAESLHRRALEINERLGDQAAIATSCYQLGRLALDQGDYATGGPLHFRSLDISERLGDQAGVAASYIALADASETIGDPDLAVRYRVGALVIELDIGTARVGHVQRLLGLRRRLGSDRFRGALPAGMDEESEANLMNMLDEQENTTGD
jgi:tetratricopeptide (TPR) repeat protein